MKYQIISERKAKYEIKVSYPSDLFPALKKLASSEKEYFYVATLDGAHKVIKIHLISMGILNRTLIHPREIFKPAILDSAASIIIAHNHPSGELTPSNEDREVTERISTSGELLGINVLDHMIFSAKDYLSFAETGEFSIKS